MEEIIEIVLQILAGIVLHFDHVSPITTTLSSVGQQQGDCSSLVFLSSLLNYYLVNLYHYMIVVLLPNIICVGLQ